uniref:Uncharacterized protein n=1 Tax=Lepeophtheirus salmonis TaxID=72036 RepID=A0A0K2TEJ8_LEPSM
MRDLSQDEFAFLEKKETHTLEELRNYVLYHRLLNIWIYRVVQMNFETNLQDGVELYVYDLKATFNDIHYEIHLS